MKNLAFLAALALGASSLAGCAEFTSALSSFDSAVTSPANEAAVATLAQAGIVFVCDVSAVANLAISVEAAAQSSASVMGKTGLVAAASAAACTGLGGLVSGTMTVPAGTPVVQ
jgi:hypothetical protein